MNDMVKHTREILAKQAPWILKHLSPDIIPTRTQQPRDLIAIALRQAGFDIYASTAKATEIINKAAYDEFQERA